MNKSQYAVAIGARPFAGQSRGFIWASSWFLPVSKRASRPRFAPSAPPRFPNPSHKRADDENPDFPPLACTPVNTPSVRPPTSSRRPQGGLPCIERTRDAHGRSNVPRPLQSRFEARQKPEGYTSTQTGLKRLRTQITAFRGNENRKGRHQAPPTYTQAQTHSCKRRVRRFLFWWSVAYTVPAVVGVTAPLRPRRRHRPPASPRAPSRTWTGRRTVRGR